MAVLLSLSTVSAPVRSACETNTNCLPKHLLDINRRLKGVGMGPVIVSFIVVQYFTVNLAWIMNYFRYSFTSPLPWENRIEEFYWSDVLQVGDIIEGSLSADGNSVVRYQQYPSRALIGETVGWSIFIWFLIWISIFRGVGMTGRVVYVCKSRAPNPGERY